MNFYSHKHIFFLSKWPAQLKSYYDIIQKTIAGSELKLHLVTATAIHFSLKQIQTTNCLSSRQVLFNVFSSNTLLNIIILIKVRSLQFEIFSYCTYRAQELLFI